MAVVYRHIRLDKNEPFYIGIGKSEKRAFCKNRNDLWKSIINKSEYRIDILFADLTWEEACEKEKEFIKLYGRIDQKTGTLANMTDGGDGTCNRETTDITKQKISQTKKGRKHTQQAKLNMSEAHKGQKCYMFGVSKTQEQKDKISQKNKGLKRSDEFKQNLSKKNTGSNNPNYGKKVSTETRNKISNWQKNRSFFHKSKLKPDDVLKLKNLLIDGFSIKQISEIMCLATYLIYGYRKKIKQGLL